MWQVYAYVPAVANVRVIDTFVLLPAMSAGAPACCVKNTLCGTDPNANVTVSPTFTGSVPGVNVRDGVAATVLSVWGGAVVPYPLPPHAITINAPARVARMSPVLRVSIFVSVFDCEPINLGLVRRTVLIETSTQS